MGVCACVSVCVCVCVCVMKMDNALAQVLYILFSCIHPHKIKQITQIKINKSTLFIKFIKISTKSKLKYDDVIIDAMSKGRLKFYNPIRILNDLQ